MGSQRKPRNRGAQAADVSAAVDGIKYRKRVIATDYDDKPTGRSRSWKRNRKNRWK